MDAYQYHLVNLNLKLPFDVSMLDKSDYADAEGHYTGDIILPALCVPKEILESFEGVWRVHTMFGLNPTEFRRFHKMYSTVWRHLKPVGWMCGRHMISGPLWYNVKDLEKDIELMLKEWATPTECIVDRKWPKPIPSKSRLKKP